jgi:hypothetical protein
LFAEVKVDDTDWEYEHELGLVDDDLMHIADKCRADETKKMVNAIEVSTVLASPQETPGPSCSVLTDI